jgi:hypothetical protein
MKNKKSISHYSQMKNNKQIITIPQNLNNVKLQEEDFDAHTKEVGEAILVYLTWDGRLVPELVVSLDPELTGSNEEGLEGADRLVEVVS